MHCRAVGSMHLTYPTMGSMQGGAAVQLTQALAEQQALCRVVAQEQRTLQVEALGLRAVQVLVQFGAGQVIDHRRRAEQQHAFGILERGQVVVRQQVQLAQVAGQAQEQGTGIAAQQVAGVQVCIRALVAQQQFPAVTGIQAAPATGIEQVVGTRYAEQEVAREVHPLQRDLQPARQFQGDQRQRQRLAAAALQYRVQQGRVRAQRAVFILVEIQLVEAPQQGLRQFLCGQGRQAGPNLCAQAVDVAHHFGRLQRRIMFGGHPQCRLEEGGGLTVKAGKAVFARAHGHLR